MPMPGAHMPVEPTRKKCPRLTQTLNTKMKSGLKIDRHIGDVVVGNLTVNSETKPGDVEPLFRLGAEITVRVLHETIPCMFATATVEDGSRRIKVDLRFERGVLVHLVENFGSSFWHFIISSCFFKNRCDFVFQFLNQQWEIFVGLGLYPWFFGNYNKIVKKRLLLGNGVIQ